MTVWPAAPSSEAVGSSEMMRRGECTSARAMATRCCWPPDSSDGYLVLVRAEAEGIKELARPLDRDAVRRALDKKRDRRVLGCGERGQQIELLKDEADGGGAEPRQSRPLRVDNRVPNTSTSPASADRIPAITEMNVVLPQPEGPTR